MNLDRNYGTHIVTLDRIETKKNTMKMPISLVSRLIGDDNDGIKILILFNLLRLHGPV